MSARFLLPSINQKLFLKCSMKWHYISTCFEHFSIFGPELWIHIVFKEYRWIKQQCHVRPLLVRQGYFDIFFPTDFECLRDIFSQPLVASVSPLSTSSSPLLLGAGFNTWRTQLCQEMGRVPFLISTRLAEEFHPLPYYNRGRLVQVDPRLLVWCWLQATPRLLIHTLPSAVIMASIVSLCNQNLLPTWDQNGWLPLSTAMSKVPSANCRARTSISCFS